MSTGDLVPCKPAEILAESKPPEFLPETATLDQWMSPAPFEYLYSIDDPFKQSLLLEEYSKVAASRHGIRNIKTLWENFRKSVVHQTHDLNSVTEFIGQPIELKCGTWRCDESGVWTTGNFQVQICQHPIMPIARYKNLDDYSEKLEIAYKRGNPGRWFRVVVDKDVLSTAQKISQLYSMGISITSHNAKEMVDYFQKMESMNIDILPERSSTSRVGWVEDDVFLPYSKEVVFDGEASFRHLFETITTEGDFAKWRETMLEFRRLDVSFRAALAASFASPLLELIDALPAFVHLWSDRSATGKTVALMGAASVWGDPAIGNYVQTFNTTEVASEHTCAFLNSLPLVMDELQLAKDRHGKFHFNVYKISSGTGRARGKRTGGIERVSTWRLFCITSGESPLTGEADGSGAYARTLEIEMRRQVVSLEDGQRIVKSLTQNFGHAGRMFMEHVQTLDREELNERYLKIVREVMNGDSVVQDKQGMAAAALLLADAIADEVIFQDEQGRLTADEMRPFLLPPEEISIAQRAYDVVMDWHARHAFRFEDECEYERFGHLDKATGRLYVIRSVFNDLMRESGFSERSVLSAMAKEELVETITEGNKIRYDKRMRIARNLCRVVSFVIEPQEGEEFEGGFMTYEQRGY